MIQWWQYWPNHFSNLECDKLIELAEQLPVKDASVGIVNSVHNETIRRSKIRWIPRYDSRFFSLFMRMELLFQEGNRNAFGFDMAMFHEVQFTEYHATNEGHYDWHIDTEWSGPKLQVRKLSMVVQLSHPEDYDGGRFELDVHQCQEVPPPEEVIPRGTVIMFPAFLRHRVTPVTRGLRRSLVSWMEGPGFR